MYKTPKCIENDTYSQNSLFLARMNFYKSGEAFFERLAEAAADDSQLHVARVTDDVVLVTGEHIGTRKLTIRLGRSREEVKTGLQISSEIRSLSPISGVFLSASNKVRGRQLEWSATRRPEQSSNPLRW